MIQKDKVVWQGNEQRRGETKVKGVGGILDRRRDGGAESKQTSGASALSGLNAEDVDPADRDSVDLS